MCCDSTANLQSSFHHSLVDSQQQFNLFGSRWQQPQYIEAWLPKSDTTITDAHTLFASNPL